MAPLFLTPTQLVKRAHRPGQQRASLNSSIPLIFIPHSHSHSHPDPHHFPHLPLPPRWLLAFPYPLSSRWPFVRSDIFLLHHLFPLSPSQSKISSNRLPPFSPAPSFASSTAPQSTLTRLLTLYLANCGNITSTRSQYALRRWLSSTLTRTELFRPNCIGLYEPLKSLCRFSASTPSEASCYGSIAPNSRSLLLSTGIRLDLLLPEIVQQPIAN